MRSTRAAQDVFENCQGFRSNSVKLCDSGAVTRSRSVLVKTFALSLDSPVSFDPLTKLGIGPPKGKGKYLRDSAELVGQAA